MRGARAVTLTSIYMLRLLNTKPQWLVYFIIYSIIISTVMLLCAISPKKEFILSPKKEFLNSWHVFQLFNRS